MYILFIVKLRVALGLGKWIKRRTGSAEVLAAEFRSVKVKPSCMSASVYSSLH